MKWISNPLHSSRAKVLAGSLLDSRVDISSSALPVLADLLVSRGIDDPETAMRFLFPTLADLHDPLQMRGMKAAVDRLEAALERRERVLIYGDYDVDGTTAIVILKTAIELCGGAADFHVPHRIREGYGMSDEVIERANNNPNGLGGSIWSKDLNKAKQLALQLQCGTAWINKHSPVQPNAPFGGVKSSGFGVEFGEEGLAENTDIQVIWS